MRLLLLEVESHLRYGLVQFERTRGLFFSSGLVFRFVESHGKVVEGSWQARSHPSEPSTRK